MSCLIAFSQGSLTPIEHGHILQNWIGPHLVGVLQDEVLALVQLTADVDDAAQDPPGVLHAQVDLAGELVGLELLRAEDHVARRVFHVVAGHVPTGSRPLS